MLIHSALYFYNTIMIYLTKSEDNTVITDSLLSVIPTSLTIYLDDTLVGTYDNLSTHNSYIKFTVLEDDISTFQEKEYELIIKSNNSVIKNELIIVKESGALIVKSISKTNKVKMYD